MKAHSGKHGRHNGLSHAHSSRQVGVHDLLKVFYGLLNQWPSCLHPCKMKDSLLYRVYVCMTLCSMCVSYWMVLVLE